MKKRVCCLILTLLLAFWTAGMFANAAGAVPITLSGIHDAQLNRLAMYSFDGSTAGTRDLLAGVPMRNTDATVREYALSLEPGDYWIEGFDANGVCNGGISLNIRAGGNNNFTIQRVYELRASNSGWLPDTDYQTTLRIHTADGESRVCKTGMADNYGNMYPSCLFVLGDTLQADFEPIGERAKDYLTAHAEKKPTVNCSLTATLYAAAELRFTAPAGSEISVGKLTNYYVYDFFHAVQTSTQDGRIEATFRVPKQKMSTGGPSFFCRVRHPEGVTYWDFFDPTSAGDPAVEVSQADLFIGDAAHTAQTVVRDFRYNSFDKADLYLNANAAGCIALPVGHSTSLSAFRNWMAIEHVYNSRVALPDMHYRVIDPNGHESDLLQVSPDEGNSGLVSLRAQGEGVAILLISYDAMFSTQAYVDSKPYQPNFFSALWPENTGVLVVRCGSTDTGFDTGMTMHGDGGENALDAELDPLFYTGKDGAQYTFTPPAGSTVTVDRSTVTDTMTFSGFTSDGVQTAADGSVTITGLTTGRHIVRIDCGSKTAYQVITARQIEYARRTETFDALDNQPLRAGGTAYLQFSGLTNPVEKMSGIYNHSPRIRYRGADGSEVFSALGGQYGVYDFSGNPVRQRLSVQIPKYWTASTYTLSDGCIAERVSGSAPGAHRAVSFNIGINPDFNAGGKGVLQGALPEITLSLQKTDFLFGTLSCTTDDGTPIDRDTLQITLTDAEGEQTAVDSDGRFACFNGDYTYTIEGESVEPASGTLTVTKDGETFAVTLISTDKPARPLTLWQRILHLFQKIRNWIVKVFQTVQTYFKKLRNR